MEEKILMESEHYNIKQVLKKASMTIVILSILVSVCMYFSYYASDYNRAKRTYTESYLPKQEKLVQEYNDIIATLEEKGEYTCLCEHAKTTTIKDENYWGDYTKEITLSFTKEDFVEAHPSAKEYAGCSLYNSIIWYDDWNEYKNNAVTISVSGWRAERCAIPLLANALILLFVLVYFWLRSYSLVITDKRVYGKTAFGKQVDLPLDSVSAVGTSALKGIAVGTSSGKIRFKLIKNQKDIHRVISKLLAESQTVEKTFGETTVQQTIVETTGADEIKKYKELLDCGAITQEEFDAKKKELLGL